MDKNTQRRIALEARRSLTPETRRAASREICTTLRRLLADHREQIVFSYLAEPDEPDLRYLTGFVTAYPVSGPGGVMEACIPAADDPLAPGRFGIPAPDPARGRLVLADEIGVVLAPCVAFDKKCRRLGRGGGYYDRYLQTCAHAMVVAVAFEAQRLDTIAADAYDMPVDLVVTEAAVYRR